MHLGLGWSWVWTHAAFDEAMHGTPWSSACILRAFPVPEKMVGQKGEVWVWSSE